MNKTPLPTLFCPFYVEIRKKILKRIERSEEKRERKRDDK